MMQNRVSFIKFADVKVPVMKELPNKGWVLFGEDNKNKPSSKTWVIVYKKYKNGKEYTNFQLRNNQ